MPKLNIILTCDGGSGHKSAAEALKMKATANGDKFEVINTTQSGWFCSVSLGMSSEYDHLLYNHGLFDAGPAATKWWDWAQRTSQTELLRVFASLRKLSALSMPSFRHRTYHLLADRTDINDYSEVIFHNTQPNCVQALVFSIARYNCEVKADNLKHPQSNQRNTVRYVNHFTDMPTLQALMFIEEIDKIDVANLDDARFELHTRPPIIEDDNPNHSPADIELLYHQRIKQLYPKLYQNLPPNTDRVKFVNGPIREAFVLRKENPAKRCDGLSIQFTNQAEFDDFNYTLDSRLGEFNVETSHVTMPLEENTEIVSIMLGSQASIEGTLGLVQEEIKIAESSSRTKNVFVFCGANKPSEGLVLYQKILNIAQQVNVDRNSSIKIIPLTAQPGSLIADIYSLADRIITRPGGISIMEIEAVVKKGKIFIFTELSKLDKLFNQLLTRSDETLKKQFSKQQSQQRYTDLIAWEWGNALHARNTCKDENGRTRVVPVNVYTFQAELEFSNKKDVVAKLIVDEYYSLAFHELMTNPKLNVFFLTGYDIGVDLAFLVEVTQLYEQISNELSELLEKNPELKTLENGPKATLALIRQASNRITSKLAQQDTPANILKDVPSQINNIRASLKNSIDVVKQSNIENKTVIIRTLEFLSRAFVNFFRSLLGLNLHFSPETDLENLNKNFTKAINRPVMAKINQYGGGDVLSPSLPLSNVNASQWNELDKIIETIPPEEKNKIFIIKKSDYSQLEQDFLFCGSLEGGEPVNFAISKKICNGGMGNVSFLKNRHGEPAVMKEHTKMRANITMSKIEFEGLKKMGLLLNGIPYSSDDISVFKYIPGETLHKYVQKPILFGLFVTYKSLTDEKKLKLGIALVTALKNVSDNGIVHGDITPPNILIQEDAHDHITASIIDFGLAHMKQYPSLKFLPYISPYYGAPELLQVSSLHKEGDPQMYPYSDKSDIYSLGIILKDLGIDPTLTEQMTAKDPVNRPEINEVLTTLSTQWNALDSNNEEEADSEHGPKNT